MAQKFCKQCGATLKEGLKFCNKCGAPIVQETQVSNQKAVDKKLLIVQTVVCILLVMFFISVGLFALINPFDLEYHEEFTVRHIPMVLLAGFSFLLSGVFAFITVKLFIKIIKKS